jgi:SAM-dependent methyltransferase
MISFNSDGGVPPPQPPNHHVGNYSVAVAPHVGALSCLDGNASMLQKCKEKVAAQSTTPATFLQGLLPELPFDNHTFDSVMCNLVVHHIEDDNTRGEFSTTAALLKEVQRVLKPGGTFCMNHIVPEQVDTYWFLSYVPECKERWRNTLVPGDRLVSLYNEAGLVDVQRTTPLDYVLFRPMETYLDPAGPLDPEWRKSTSMWAVGDQEELDVGMWQLAVDNDTGAVHSVLAECETLRKTIGHTSFFYGRVPV